MPIYEYVCRHCGHAFEVLVRGQEKPVCPACGHSKLDRQWSVPAAHSAGSSGAPCPARETGACNVPRCGGNRCDMSQWL